MKYNLLYNFHKKEIKKKKISHLKGATQAGKFLSKSYTGLLNLQ